MATAPSECKAETKPESKPEANKEKEAGENQEQLKCKVTIEPNHTLHGSRCNLMVSFLCVCVCFFCFFTCFLFFQTWVLRVSIHCEGCKRKVHKILTNIDGMC